jgi:hypothetical protein
MGYREEELIGNSTFLSKEPQHFNRWPMLSTNQYLQSWNSSIVDSMLTGATGQQVLLDASPQYLLTAATPVRIKAAAPHAKFVLIIRVWSLLLVKIREKSV